MPRNLVDAVMELERLKRSSTPEAIKERAAAKAAQLDASIPPAVADLLQALDPAAKAERPIMAYFRGREEPARYTAAILPLLQTDPDIERITDAETGEVIYRRADGCKRQ